MHTQTHRHTDAHTDARAGTKSAGKDVMMGAGRMAREDTDNRGKHARGRVGRGENFERIR